MDDKKRILWRSLVLTILIFAVGILLNHVFDSFRISIIEDVMRIHEVDSEAYRVDRLFTETFGGDTCRIMISRISDLKKEIRKVGEDLGSYSKFSFFRKKDFDYLKRKYFLLQLRFLATIQKLNTECDKPYIPIIFFYEIDDDLSERQGFILAELSKGYKQQIIVLSLDKDYEDEPLVNLLVSDYNITEAPALVIDDKVYTGLLSTGEINATVQKILRKADPYAEDIDFMFTPRAAGINIGRLTEQIERVANDEQADPFARGDATLALGRLTKNKTMICKSLQYYDQVNSTNPEEQALVYETGSSLGCGRNKAAFRQLASEKWHEAGNQFRAELLAKLVSGGSPELEFDPEAINAKYKVISGYVSPILPKLNKTNADFVTIGSTSIKLHKGDVVVSQDDRVYRDWLGGQIANPYGPKILVTFSERLNYDPKELLPEIGWHEGARINDLKQIGIKHIPAVGTLVAQYGARWYAVDEKGIFRFEVPKDKLLYPTTRFLRKNLAVVIDTHGVNMIVEQAIRNKAKAVVSDCDHPAKVYAAKYLSDRGISVICFPDKYTYLALGHDLDLVGSPPTKIIGNTAIIGNRPVTIGKHDKILAVNATDQAYALWYYQTPASYFNELEKAIDLDVTYVNLEGFGQMEKVTRKARELGANILATRIFNSADYNAVKNWLDENSGRKVILFHSASYPYGQKLFREYNKVTFDDPNPIFK